MRLILFDIDGTLIRGGSKGRQVMAGALEQVFGTAGAIDTYDFSGSLDSRIVTDLLLNAGIPTTRITQKLPHLYQVMAEIGETLFFEAPRPTPCPGILPLLEKLGAHERIAVGLLTGNCRQTAPLKLKSAGIDPAQFAIGAYGDDALDRNHLPPIALKRASSHFAHPFNGSNTIIIGDTPADILCAKSNGITSVAVATGWKTEEALSLHNPDLLLPNLSAVEAIFRFMTGLL